MPTGSCLCGEVRYEYTGDPVSRAICHCLTCRKVSGGTNTVCCVIPEDKFTITAGSVKQFTTVHESGMHLTVNFCGTCGTTLYKTTDKETFKGNAIVQAGTVDDLTSLDHAVPDMELFVKYRTAWLPALSQAAQQQEFP